MGAHVARMFRNFNLENRVHREISKEKPLAAPRHAADLAPSAGSSEGECLTSRLDVGSVGLLGVMSGLAVRLGLIHSALQ